MRYHWNHDALEMKLLHYKKIQIGENWFKYDGKPLLMEKLELVIGGGRGTWIKYLKYGILGSPIKFKHIIELSNETKTKFFFLLKINLVEICF